MSDEQGGYEHDLREAENAMAAAGHPDIALGMRRHSEAQRNMMQGVLVPMFVKMVERALDQKLAPLSNEIGGLRGDSAALQAEFRTGLSSLQAVVSTLVETVDDLQQDRQAIHTALTEVVERLDRKRLRLDALEAQVRELRGPEMSPEQRQHVIETLLQMSAWWDRVRPDIVD